MRRLYFIIVIMLVGSFSAVGQQNESFRAQHDAFKASARAKFDLFKGENQRKYNEFRDKVNQEYADFLRQAWEQAEVLAPLDAPKEDNIIPEVLPLEERNKPLQGQTVIVIDSVLPTPEVPEQPQPFVPIQMYSPNTATGNFASVPQRDLFAAPPVTTSDMEGIIEHITVVQEDSLNTNRLPFDFLGVRLYITKPAEELRFTLYNLQSDMIAFAWERMSRPAYNNIIVECLALRKKYNLCDWSYLRMIEKVAEAFLGKNTNEAELLKAFIYCQSGYQMRMVIINDAHLSMFYSSPHEIYDKVRAQIDGQFYYSDYVGDVHYMHLSNIGFPKEKQLSLYVTTNQSLIPERTTPRIMTSKDDPNMSLWVTSDYGALSFSQLYPRSDIYGRKTMCWYMYAMKPMSPIVVADLYPTLRNLIDGMSDYDAVNFLCHWIQMAFPYAEDPAVWGEERVFFPEETLYYPYSDCEDRSILFTRLVRDLLGLPCALLYYPGHLAAAVALGDEALGEGFLINGIRYVICDPTYEGASIGLAMNQYKGTIPKVELLN